MGLTFAQLENLKDRLQRISETIDASDSDLLRLASHDSPFIDDALLAGAVTRIAAHLHHPANDTARHLARGALSLALRLERDESPSIVLSVEMAVAVIDRISADPTFDGQYLDEHARGTALAMLDRCTAEPGKEDLELLDEVCAFLDTTEDLERGLIFSRFREDLSFLAEVLGEATRAPDERRRARGALVYFLKRDDAIGDDLGLAGVLDDAYVARFVADGIDQQRHFRNVAIDTLLARWPFLQRLHLVVDEEAWTPSTSLLLSLAASLLPPIPSRSALVLPSTGQIPLLIGTAVALARLYDWNLDARQFRPEAGTYVAPSGGTGHTLRVVAYEKVGGRDGVRLAYLPERGPEVIHWRPISVLDRYVAANPPNRRRRGVLRDKPADVRLGALERLFATERPLQQKESGHRVVVIGQLGLCEEILSKSRLYGSPLTDVLPTGRFDDAGQTLRWSNCHGAPVLVVAKTSSEAAAAVEMSSATHHLVLPMDAADRDEAALDRILDRGASATALLTQSSFAVQDHLARREFGFLDWTPSMLPHHRHRPRPTDGSANPFLDSESRIVDELESRIELHTAELPESDSAYAALRALRRAAEADYDEDLPPALETWIARGVPPFFLLDALPVPLRSLPDDAATLASRLIQLEHDLKRGASGWLERSRTAATEYLGRLQALRAALQETSPKGALVTELLSRRSDAVIACSDQAWGQLQIVGIGGKRRQAEGASRRVPVVRFEWPKARNLPKLVLPSFGSPGLFVLHRWAAGATARVLGERARRLKAHWSDGQRWRSLGATALAEEQRLSVPAPSAAADTTEEWAAQVRTRQLVREVQAESSGSEIVEARLLQFSGNRYGFFTPDHTLQTATHLLHKLGSETSELRPKSAAALERGDVVVILEGSDSDVLRERADARLPVGCRDMARTWSRALTRAEQRFGSERALCLALVRGGCTVAEQTIRAWIKPNSQIGPMNEADLEVIARVTGDGELTPQLEACRAAIALVRGEHLRASQELAREVIARLRTALAGGASIGEALRLDARVLLLTVELVQDTASRVPSNVVNRVRVLS